MSKRKRIIYLIIIGLFSGAALLAHLPSSLAQKRRAARPPQDRAALAKKPAPSGTLKDRLDKDDGYALTIFYSADIHGNLEVCGCPIYPLGGVARRLGYINAFRKRSPDAAVVTVDVGRLFADETVEGAPELRADARLMNDWIVRANEALGLDVFNLSYRDLPYAASLLRPDARLKLEKAALVSANIKAAEAGRHNPAPYVIKTVTGKRLKEPVRIAFIGLSDTPPDDFQAAVAASGFVVNDPLAAAKAALAAVHEQADVTVVIGYLNRSTVNRLARENDDLDVIITIDEKRIVFDPMQINNALVLYAAKETKHLGELRCYAGADGVIERFTNRYVELDQVIPDDPQMAAITKQARGEIEIVQTRMAEEEATRVAEKLRTGGLPASPYATSAACAKCHVAEYERWQKTRHAQAFVALAAKQRVYDAACVGCHSVGFQQQGFINVKATPQFANVQCESCHGPGAAHAVQPVKGQYPTPAAPAACVKCHDRDNSPDFVFEKYWPVVAHGKLQVTTPNEASGKGRAKRK